MSKDAQELLALANSIEQGHARVQHLDAENQWAPYKVETVVAALRTAASISEGRGDREAIARIIAEVMGPSAANKSANEVADAILALSPPSPDVAREALEQIASLAITPDTGASIAMAMRRIAEAALTQSGQSPVPASRSEVAATGGPEKS